jgi:hypothetical protein
VTTVVKHLPSKHKALASTPSTAKEKRGERGEDDISSHLKRLLISDLSKIIPCPCNNVTQFNP